MIRVQVTGSPAYVGRTGGIRILFVEDDEGYRANLVAKLSERGFVVHCFTDATWLLRSLDSAVEGEVIVRCPRYRASTCYHNCVSAE
jgi:phage-related protein